MMSKIGFIGLGIMGIPMSKNLKKAGFDLLVGVRNDAKRKEAEESGIAVAESFAQVARECDIIVTMLPNSPHVKELLLGENGIAKEAKPGTLFVDMTSGAPGDSRDIYAELKKMDIHFEMKESICCLEEENIGQVGMHREGSIICCRKKRKNGGRNAKK